jgi:hypothetical protein
MMAAEWRQNGVISVSHFLMAAAGVAAVCVKKKKD